MYECNKSTNQYIHCYDPIFLGKVNSILKQQKKKKKKKNSKRIYKC